MGVLQRFERRLEGLVEGAFARAFGGKVEPVEVAAALQRETADRRAIVGPNRVLVPNEYIVELGESDFARFSEYDEALRRELAAMVEEHATEQGWSFVGRVAVRFESNEGVATGTFRVRSKVASPDDALPRRPLSTDRVSECARLVLEAPSAEGERVIPLQARVTVLGRGSEADLRVADTGVSRLHAEVRLEGQTVTLVDLDSTNGTSVNGRRISSAVLRDGDTVELGATRLVFREPDGGGP